MNRQHNKLIWWPNVGWKRVEIVTSWGFLPIKWAKGRFCGCSGGISLDSVEETRNHHLLNQQTNQLMWKMIKFLGNKGSNNSCISMLSLKKKKHIKHLSNLEFLFDSMSSHSGKNKKDTKKWICLSRKKRLSVWRFTICVHIYIYLLLRLHRVGQVVAQIIRHAARKGLQGTRRKMSVSDLKMSWRAKLTMNDWKEESLHVGTEMPGDSKSFWKSD